MADYDPSPMQRRPFNLTAWIEDHRDELKPPVANKQIWREADMVVMIVGGGNRRNDFHDDPREEFFYPDQRRHEPRDLAGRGRRAAA